MHTSAGRGQHRWAGPAHSPASKHAANGAGSPVGGLAARGHTCLAAHPGPPGRSPRGASSRWLATPDGPGWACCSSGLVPVTACLVGAGLACLPTLDPPAPLPAPFGLVWAVGSAGGSGRRPTGPSIEFCRPAFPSIEFCRPACSDQPNLPTACSDRLLCSQTIRRGQHSTVWPSQHGTGSLSADQPAASYVSQPMARHSAACQLRTSPGPNPLEHTRPIPLIWLALGPNSELAHPPRPSHRRRGPPSRHRHQPLPSSPVFCFPPCPPPVIL